MNFLFELFILIEDLFIYTLESEKDGKEDFIVVSPVFFNRTIFGVKVRLLVFGHYQL